MNKCFYFLYPYSGGSLDLTTGRLSKHSQVPGRSEKICFDKCSDSFKPLSVSPTLEGEPLFNSMERTDNY